MQNRSTVLLDYEMSDVITGDALCATIVECARSKIYSSLILVNDKADCLKLSEKMRGTSISTICYKIYISKTKKIAIYEGVF